MSAQSSRLTSRLTKKFQVTVPWVIRQKFGLKSGDIIYFELRNGDAFLRKETPLNLPLLQVLEGQLTERQSEADEDAYRAL